MEKNKKKLDFREFSVYSELFYSWLNPLIAVHFILNIANKGY